jgi:hypothetical protein
MKASKQRIHASDGTSGYHFVRLVLELYGRFKSEALALLLTLKLSNASN